jgi:hypothetical protein
MGIPDYRWVAMKPPRRPEETPLSYHYRILKWKEDQRVIQAIFGEELPDLLSRPNVFVRSFQRLADRITGKR